MIIVKLSVFIVVLVMSVFLCCFRMSGYHTTIEDSEYLNYGMTIKEIQKYTKKHKLAVTINDGKILYLAKEQED